MNSVACFYWACVFLFWVGFVAGDKEPRKDNKNIIKVVGWLLLLSGCVLVGIYLGGR